MRSSLGLLVIMLLAAGVGVIAAHSQSQVVATPTAQPAPISPPVAQSGTVYMMGPGSGSSGAGYVPATLTVRVGQKVTWINRDVSGHTATADDGAFNSDVLNPGQHYSWTPKRAGTFPYSDYNQSDLQGTIVVKP
jgi:plastocyanin